jgi:hypothetical protein
VRCRRVEPDHPPKTTVSVPNPRFKWTIQTGRRVYRNRFVTMEAKRARAGPLASLLHAKPGLVDTFAGAVAGVASALVTNPLEVVKVRRQNAQLSSTAPIGTFAALKNLVQTEGVKGLYRGFSATLLGYLPTWAIYFTA